MPVYRRKQKDPETGKIRLGNYYYKFVVDGVTYKATVKTARTTKQAEEAERQARQDLHDGIYGRKASRKLFSEFANGEFLAWAKLHHADTVNEVLRIRVLCEHFQSHTLAQITEGAIEGFKSEFAKKRTRHDRERSPQTVNNHLAQLSCIMARAVGLKYVKRNPCEGVAKLPVPEATNRRLADEEERALLGAAVGFIAPMIRLALWTGMRQCELIALKRQSLDFLRNRYFVRNPKWKKDPRKVQGNPMSPEVRELLATLWRSAESDYLFSDKGERLTRAQVNWAFRLTRQAAGVSGFRFHDLRHEYGSRLGDADVNLKKIARLMGHSDTKMTERYVHPDEDSLLAATAVSERRSSGIVPDVLRAVV